MEMNRMKEENRVSRKVVEQKLKDYHDLQMKFATIQLNNQEKDPQSFLSLRGNNKASQEPNTVPKILGITNQSLLSPSPTDGIRESELGLSLRLHTYIEEQEQVEAQSNSTTRSTLSSMVTPTLPSSSESRWDHDVFLSFKGEDTRKSFTDHLYSALVKVGIRTFRDDEELPRGENMPTKLLNAIQGSRISIVIFSKSYASSSWCLNELVEIMNSKNTIGCTLLSIFYHVGPLDVRKQTRTFVEAFARYELRFIKEIVEEVLCKVNLARLDVAKHPIGIESRVHHIKDLLNLGTSGVRIVGIYGMGGRGKTTLTKAVYNQICVAFERNDFENLHVLGEKQWFGPGSRIVVTTRDEHLLSQLGVDEKYKVELNRWESLQLFSWHAFKMVDPKQDYSELTIEAVDYAGGIPLALVIQKILGISFDSLDSSTKDIFLDIACFFVGMDKEYAIKILYGCNFSPGIAISILIQRSLVTIDYQNKLKVHNLIHDMGREIVCEESPKYPGKHILKELYAEKTAIKQLPPFFSLLKNLETVSLCGCECLIESPEFLETSRLETLILEDCASLVENDCIELDKLPKQLGNMTALKEILADITAIEQLPSSFSRLRNLGIVLLSGSGGPSSSWISLKSSNHISLLASISRLSSLTKLDLNDCNLSEDEIPIELGCLSSLRELMLCKTDSSSLCLPGSEIPNWFSHQTIGSLISFHVPSFLDGKMGKVLVCVVYAANKELSRSYICSHDTISSYNLEMKSGDEIELSVDLGDQSQVKKCEIQVKKCGIHLLVDEPNVMDEDGSVV
ncbi:disease resistance protein RUN1-like [Corylus avellana]|uniref:disease resistance protein RUN1-like n=1 Tax=Corylus avellana TaxID=13451 RepID=UPI00286AC313|nr:disease resistance protein RUN1-like [Corylus avellana]